MPVLETKDPEIQRLAVHRIAVGPGSVCREGVRCGSGNRLGIHGLWLYRPGMEAQGILFLQYLWASLSYPPCYPRGFVPDFSPLIPLLWPSFLPPLPILHVDWCWNTLRTWELRVDLCLEKEELPPWIHQQRRSQEDEEERERKREGERGNGEAYTDSRSYTHPETATMSTDTLDLKAADFDANVWWHLTEGRVDDYKKKTFSSQLAQADSGIMDVGPNRDQYWQLQPVDDVAGRYALRCSKTGVFKQLGVCYVADEIANSRTQPCLVSSSGADAQKWDVADWGNSTYRFVNVANGTGYVLDVHPGNPPFMSDDLRTNIPQPAQHWLMTSVKKVDDGAFSTVFSNVSRPPFPASS